MINFDWLARWLIACQKHPDADGTIPLSFSDACNLVSMGFRDALPGRWRVLALPPDTIRRYPAMAQFAAPESALTNSTTAVAAERPTASSPKAQMALPPTAPTFLTTPRPVSARLVAARRDPFQRRILASLVKRSGSCAKRHLQQRLHRISARDLNVALNRLQAVGLVIRNGARLVLDPEARELLVKARFAVSRPRSARAGRRASDRGLSGVAAQDNATQLARSQDHQLVHAVKQDNKRVYRRRPVPDRRQHPRKWGLSMRARRGGLAVQKLYRWLGVHPTNAATASREARHAQQRAAVAAAATAVAPISATAHQPTPRGVSYSGTATAISAALKYSEAIGRRERLGRR